MLFLCSAIRKGTQRYILTPALCSSSEGPLPPLLRWRGGLCHAAAALSSAAAQWTAPGVPRRTLLLRGQAFPFSSTAAGSEHQCFACSLGTTLLPLALFALQELWENAGCLPARPGPLRCRARAGRSAGLQAMPRGSQHGCEHDVGRQDLYQMGKVLFQRGRAFASSLSWCFPQAGAEPPAEPTLLSPGAHGPGALCCLGESWLCFPQAFAWPSRTPTGVCQLPAGWPRRAGEVRSAAAEEEEGNSSCSICSFAQRVGSLRGPL